MDEGMQVVSEVSMTKIVAAELSADPVEAVKGELHPVPKEGMKEEETTIDRDFIKVESLDLKDSSHVAELTSVEHVIDETSSSSSRELLETQEKIKELEVELGGVGRLLKNTDSDNVQLKEELSHAQRKLESTAKMYDDLELSHKKLQVQVIESEERCKSELMALQKALQEQEMNYQELITVKESFNGLSLELESSRKRLHELEYELQHTAGEAQKFEELQRQSDLHAEIQMQKALEFERLLEVTKLSAKEVEDQVTSLQEEIKLLHEKIAENRKVEEALEITTGELAFVQDELTQSKSQLRILEQNLLLKDAIISEVTQELELRNVSESQIKGQFTALEDVLASTKEDLHAKVELLEDIKLKLDDEMKMKEAFEAQFTTREAELNAMQDKLDSAIAEKGTLEATVAELDTSITQFKELCSDLESKLKLSIENFCKTDSLLSQALSKNDDLEEKLKSLESLHDSAGATAAATTERNLELESFIKKSTADAEEANKQMKKLEVFPIASELKNVELDQELNLVMLRSGDAERDVKELSDKVTELSSLLRVLKCEKDNLGGLVKENEEKISLLEASVNQLALRNSELEEELQNVLGKCAEHEDRANMNHQRGLELEDLIKMSHSKAEDAAKKTSEMELLLEAEKYRIQELEEQISSLEKKCAEEEFEKQKFSNKAAELASELEAFQARSSILEITLQTATEKEKESTNCLHVAVQEKKTLENEMNNSNLKLAEMENLLGLLREELSITQQRSESLDNELKAAGLKESEALEKLKFAEEQIEQYMRALDDATERDSGLRAEHESLTRDFELKLQEATAGFSDKDTEDKSLLQKLRTLEDQAKDYEVQVIEASGKSASLKEELDHNLMKVASLETTVEELKRQIAEAENKVSQALSDNVLLVEANLQLKQQVDELKEFLKTSASEKEAIAAQLASHMETITELQDQHTQVLEFQSATDARIVDAQKKLEEAMVNISKKDEETKNLNHTLCELENQIRVYEEKTHKASAIDEKQKFELEEARSQLKNMESILEEVSTKLGASQRENEGLANVNLNLTQNLAEYELKWNDIQVKLSATTAEKIEISEQLQLSKNSAKELLGHLTADGHALKSQISLLLEENNMAKEAHSNSKRELQSAIDQLKEQLRIQQTNEGALKSEIESLKVELVEKSKLETYIKEMEEKISQNILVDKEIEVVDYDELERRTSLEQSLEKLQEKSNEVVILETKFKELEQKLKSAEAALLEKETGASQGEIKTRDIGDIGFPVSAPSKRKSKKNTETSSTSPPSTSSGTQPQTSEHSAAMSFRFILGIVIVSIVLGIILGKKY
ncbi:hypothetical protein SAY86_004087 [Trapa natans]|uniref:WIT1/2 N-terminal helical bundle domain-containing protein n=1 Tax=Trapa natans TaxID=22666 RepID=A0AAN7MDV1_TRANT|nr:hypothetical protein SAY86_004087 [Trapa natans]